MYPHGHYVDMNSELLPVDEEMTVQAGERTHRRSTSYAADKAKILARLRRIEGQVRGVQKMVEEEKYCVDVLTQLSAAIAGLRATGLLVLEDHIRGCVVDAEPEEREATIAELMGAIERFNRSVG
jgi:CsoR family transcriptional regulator, copper-sensing transcriptional repressor